MIPVTLAAEPASFNANIRLPGNTFLSDCHTPNHRDWKAHRYWQMASNDLYRAYGGICAYTCEWFSRTSATSSIDHFFPKSSYPNLAYEWSNYRLTTQKANGNKGNSVGIADPFAIASGWFVLDLPSCLIKPGTGLPAAENSMVEFTISILKLNDDDEYVQSRCNIILYYIKGDISLNYMREKYPFIAHELVRQNLLEDVKAMFKTRT